MHRSHSASRDFVLIGRLHTLPLFLNVLLINWRFHNASLNKKWMNECLPASGNEDIIYVRWWDITFKQTGWSTSSWQHESAFWRCFCCMRKIEIEIYILSLAIIQDSRMWRKSQKRKTKKRFFLIYFPLMSSSKDQYDLQWSI